MRLGFREDTRGVSALVGAVLLLGILVIALASYQAIIVPQQNAQTEFDHNQQVEDEMVELRNALLEARLDSRERATSVKLGTRYQSRTLAVNPPPATGTLQSVNPTDQTDMEVVNEFTVSNNSFIEYTPSYSEYRDAGTIRYENTLVYHEFDNGANVVLSNQRLVDSDERKIRLVSTRPSLDENGVDRVTYEPTPSERATREISNPTIEIPTELDTQDWVDILEDEDIDSINVENGVLTVTFSGTWDIVYPADDGPPGDEPPQGSPGGDRPQTEVNPAGQGAVILIDVNQGVNSTLTFRNLDNRPRTIQSARVPFFTRTAGSSGSSASEVSIIPEGGDRVPLGSNFTAVNRQIQPGGTITLTYDFDDYPGGNNAFWVTTLLLDGGDRSSYFIGGSFSPTDPGSGNGNGDDNSEEESTSPSITQFETDSIDGPGEGNSGIEVDWAVEAGDADLDEVEIEIIDPDDGTVVENEEIPVSGSSADGTEGITSSSLEGGKVYNVRLTVTDVDNLSESDTKQQEAGQQDN